MFSGEKDTMKHFRVKLNDAQPIFMKPRSVPFAIKQPIEEEMKWLEAAGILEKQMGCSGHASPLGRWENTTER